MTTATAPSEPINNERRDAIILEHLSLVKAIAVRVHENLPVQVDRWRQMVLDLRNVGLVSASRRPAEQDDMPAPDFPAKGDSQPDRICALEELRGVLSTAVKTLPERYQKVVFLYYSNELTMKEIGSKLGINESRVSQIHKTALEKMAHVLQEAGISSSRAF